MAIRSDNYCLSPPLNSNCLTLNLLIQPGIFIAERPNPSRPMKSLLQVAYSTLKNPVSYWFSCDARFASSSLTFDNAVCSMAQTPEIQCPTCLKFFVPELRAPEMPFCSMRCKMADLNRWFTEDIGLPVLPSLDDEEPEPEPPPSAPREWHFD